ncbi:MAG: hypothetical protein ABFD92_07845 [Planctomycetaceae bacterium]|nr:hypothetical protein [Planctomycetaceae bacterium]
MATIIDIADAVAAALNAHTFSAPLTARRSYRPVFDLKEMKTLHVTIVPKGAEMTAAGRGLEQTDVQIDVAVQKKLSADTAAETGEIDALMGLVEQIAAVIRQKRRFALHGGGDAVWIKTDNVPIFSQEHLGEMRQFTSVLTLTLRVIG